MALASGFVETDGAEVVQHSAYAFTAFRRASSTNSFSPAAYSTLYDLPEPEASPVGGNLSPSAFAPSLSDLNFAELSDEEAYKNYWQLIAAARKNTDLANRNSSPYRPSSPAPSAPVLTIAPSLIHPKRKRQSQEPLDSQPPRKYQRAHNIEFRDQRDFEAALNFGKQVGYTTVSAAHSFPRESPTQGLAILGAIQAQLVLLRQQDRVPKLFRSQVLYKNLRKRLQFGSSSPAAEQSSSRSGNSDQPPQGQFIHRQRRDQGAADLLNRYRQDLDILCQRSHENRPVSAPATPFRGCVNSSYSLSGPSSSQRRRNGSPLAHQPISQ